MKTNLKMIMLALLLIAPVFAGDDKPSRGCVEQQKDLNRHEQFLKDKEELLKNGPIDLVFIGDSITDGWRWDGGQADLYKTHFGKYNPYNIGISADETQHVLWRINHGELDGTHPKVAVLLIGTNNFANGNHMTVDETADGIKCVVNAIHAKVPETKVLLLGIFPRGEKSTNPFRQTVKDINEKSSHLDDGGKTITYLDIGPKFLDQNGDISPQIMPDFLHPNVKGYQIWIDAMEPTLEGMMK